MTLELEEALVKHITISILRDFVNFVYKSLSCAQRGKMEVAYSLLRKPFLDDLLLFEQLLIDKSDFINRFTIKANQNYTIQVTSQLIKEKLLRNH